MPRSTLILSAALSVTAVPFALAQQAVPGKTAGEVYKNVQILKDVPSAQLIPSMRYLSTALGVECEFCHQGVRAEETPNKATARKMMTMMMDINKNNFNGRQEVTCYTCHKGTHDPVNNPTPTGQYSAGGTIAFYRPSGAPVRNLDEVMAEVYKEETSKEQAALAASLPKPEDILAKYVTALGGESALRKITNRVITASTEVSPNVRGNGPMVFTQQIQYFKAPNLYSTTYQRLNGAINAKGFDGSDAWTQSAAGAVATLAGTDLTRAKRDADFYEAINLKGEYTRLTNRGMEKVGNREVYVLNGTVEGDNPERLYFDKETGLLVRKSIYNTTPLGRYAIQTDYSDYRIVDGVKTPFLISTLSVSPADTMVIHVEKVENNATIDAAKFIKPATKPPVAR